MALPAECGCRHQARGNSMRASHLVLLRACRCLSPSGLLSRVSLSHEMTWTSFTISPCLALQHGQVAHVDFHEPVASSTHVDRLGFELVGDALRLLVASHRGRCGLASASVRRCAACRSCPPRLRDLRHLLVLMRPTSATSERLLLRHVVQPLRLEPAQHLALILFVPRATTSATGSTSPRSLLLVALFYLKVTYFAGGSLLGLAVLVFRTSAPVCRLVGDGRLIVANAVRREPSYLLDILHAAAAGAVATPQLSLNNFFANAEGYAPYPRFVFVWMWARGLARCVCRLPSPASWRSALCAVANHQSHGLPVGIVIAFLLYDKSRAFWTARRSCRC